MFLKTQHRTKEIRETMQNTAGEGEEREGELTYGSVRLDSGKVGSLFLWGQDTSDFQQGWCFDPLAKKRSGTFPHPNCKKKNCFLFLVM